MKNTINTMLGLSLALAPFAVCAQDAPAAAPEDQPAPAPVAQPAATAPQLPSNEQVREVVSYFFGYQFGQQIAGSIPGMTIDDLDQDVFFRAAADGFRNKVAPGMRELAPVCLDMFEQELMARVAREGAENKAKGDAFLAGNAQKEGVVTLPSGLQYKVLTPVEGEQRVYDPKKDGSNAIAYVIYEGRLIDGTVFDFTEEPVEFPINEVIPGFSEALKLIPVGAEWEIYIPSNLAYGEDGPGVIGSNATLIFKVKVVKIVPMGSSASPIMLTPEMLQDMQEQGLVPVGQ